MVPISEKTIFIYNNIPKACVCRNHTKQRLMAYKKGVLVELLGKNVIVMVIVPYG